MRKKRVPGPLFLPYPPLNGYNHLPAGYESLPQVRDATYGNLIVTIEGKQTGLKASGAVLYLDIIAGEVLPYHLIHDIAAGTPGGRHTAFAAVVRYHQIFAGVRQGIALPHTAEQSIARSGRLSFYHVAAAVLVGLLTGGITYIAAGKRLVIRAAARTRYLHLSGRAASARGIVQYIGTGIVQGGIFLFTGRCRQKYEHIKRNQTLHNRS